MNTNNIITTDDGSHTLKHPCGDTYHSTHGSIQESNLVYIQNGYQFMAMHNTSLSILEVGFGTGLNALLTLNAHRHHTPNINITYHAIEPFPISESHAQALNYPQQLGTPADQFLTLHQAKPNTRIESQPKFTVIKHQMPLANFVTSDPIDLIYFDCFGPRFAPEMWTQDVFQSLWNIMAPGAVLVTYCSKGSVKRDLKDIGFSLDMLPGPPGKREMTRAIKKSKHDKIHE